MDPHARGFSTAGNARTMDDPRNSLFMHYKSLLNEIKPNGFIFENVAGLLNMEKVRSLKESKKNSHQP